MNGAIPISERESLVHDGEGIVGSIFRLRRRRLGRVFRTRFEGVTMLAGTRRRFRTASGARRWLRRSAVR